MWGFFYYKDNPFEALIIQCISKNIFFIAKIKQLVRTILKILGLEMIISKLSPEVTFDKEQPNNNEWYLRDLDLFWTNASSL